MINLLLFNLFKILFRNSDGKSKSMNCVSASFTRSAFSFSQGFPLAAASTGLDGLVKKQLCNRPQIDVDFG